MRALITGAEGMLGTALHCLLLQEHQVVALGRADIDVCDESWVYRIITEVRPQVVFHLAALTDVDACELAPADAWRVNAEGTRYVARASQAVGAWLVYPSSIAIFDGLKPVPYTEVDRPCPANVYGHSKLAGEEAARTTDRYIIARSGWLFGGGEADKKFVGKILRLARRTREIPVVVDRFGSPTYTRDLALGMIRLVQGGYTGTYHIVNSGGPASRFEVAAAILEYARLTGCNLIPVTSDAFPLPAPRPRMEAAASLHWPLAPLRNWREALRVYIAAWLSAS